MQLNEAPSRTLYLLCLSMYYILTILELNRVTIIHYRQIIHVNIEVGILIISVVAVFAPPTPSCHQHCQQLCY
jgi:hypothetical protein